MRLLTVLVLVAAIAFAPSSANAYTIGRLDPTFDGRDFTPIIHVRADNTSARLTLRTEGAGLYEWYQRVAGGKWYRYGSQSTNSTKRERWSRTYKAPTVPASSKPVIREFRMVYKPRIGKTVTSRIQKVRYLRNTSMAKPGSKAGFMYLDNDKPARWNPCTAVNVSVDVSKMSSSKRNAALADTKAAISEAAKVSGLNLRYSTSKSAQIKVTYKNPKSNAAAGTAEVTRTPKVNGTSYYGLKTATILMRPSLADKTRRGVILHEMIHAIGIGHAPNGDTIMKRLQSRWTISAQDRKVIGYVGAGQGCF
ncbi:hypothetical protein [Aeromicrobium sp. 179-A 4D2 NHS]|uniref:hypothetical protein n=1 Tax=Aeromicrobium sp. 179-A 4D2 NHS TaxID=3142375 RepID=UPI0039A0533F